MPELEDVTIPSVSFSPPMWSAPTKPKLTDHTAPDDPPPIVMPDVPHAPSLTLPDVPELGNVVIPSAPAIKLPLFDADLPDEILKTPAEFNWQESPYNSPVWIDPLTKTVDGIREGGTGLAPEVYADIWNRAVSRH